MNDDNARFGFNGGVMARSDPEQSRGLQAELLYTTKGNKTEYHNFTGFGDQTVDPNLNYLELPLMLSIRIAEGAFEVQAGGYAAYLLRSKVTTNGDFGNGEKVIDTDNFSSFDAGLVGGFAFNSGPIQVGLRYDDGLINIADSNAAKFLLSDAKHSCTQLYLAFGMP